ncbi:DUF2867 domain-containing protein [Pseudovibrio sp. SPO723]|uniref:DUF2867 domain-containing protein n=1 Tax=Nesiotobacter zosterae TaxID=392721 RepID=UPI0029C17E03|nr:DUF2867 domain-containing protein [Pseudovibrio sp. SPO723]MDX5595597.1 DUF2867 domain-containing protein [Pseudovibrio sp. SPO723]
MTAVKSAMLPGDSLLYGHKQPGDFMDCYAKPTSCSLEEVAQRMMTFPAWVSQLMRLRNALVKPFGISTHFAASETIGIFPVISRSENEIILGTDDKHLDFRISIMVRDGMAYAATWVHTKNLFGRFYLRAVMPFHILIVRRSVARA